VRVIDDASSDRTAELVRERWGDEPRLQLLPAGELPAGWQGKVHALWTGARGVATPWLLLTDADTRHHPEVLARAQAAADAGGLDAVSLAGSQEVAGGENLVVPLVFALLDGLLGDWEAAARGAGQPVANGQFILLRRAAWERAGGFATVCSEPSDDVAIARRLAAQGSRLGFFRAPGLLRVRMYQGALAAARGWRRNLAGLLGPTPRRAHGLAAALLLPSLAIPLLVLAGQPLSAILLWAGGALSSALVRAGSEHRPEYGLLFPLDALLLATLLITAAGDYRRRRLAAWKGRPMVVGPAPPGSADQSRTAS
jgi:hypothetical protein